MFRWVWNRDAEGSPRPPSGSFPHLALLAVLGAACNPYDFKQGDEFNAGPVDAANFPMAYKGQGGDFHIYGYKAGQGRFNELIAYTRGERGGYYRFPFSDSQLRATTTSQLPSDVTATELLPTGNTRPANVYAFDPEPPSPFPTLQRCTPPPNYSYDFETEDMRRDQQDNIFTQLPFATEVPGQASTFEYYPAVAEIAVSAGTLACQAIKSEGLLKRVIGTPPPTGNFLLWAIIDPASGVYRVGQSGSLSSYNFPDGGRNPAYSRGVGVQRWGWFGRYYLAYIDGGYIPTETLTVGNTARTRMIPQKVYLPTRITPEVAQCGATTCARGQVCSNNRCQTCQRTGSRTCPTGFVCGTMGALNGVCSASGDTMLNTGYGGVIEHKRGETGYSPVCRVYQYNVPNVGSPARPPAPSELPRSQEEIEQLPGSNPRPSQGPPVGATPRDDDPPPAYIYCPQVD